MNIPPCFATLSSVPSTIALLAIAGATGVLLGRICVRGVSIGTGGVLFASLALGHFGFTLDHHLMDFLRDAGLAVFVYTIGIQIGPLFFSSFKKEGLRLNILAAMLVSSGFAVAAILLLSTGTDVAKMAGAMSGAVTNTPGLGAAQQLISSADGGDPSRGDICGLAYAVTYPFGIFGIIIAILLLRRMFKVDIDKERSKINQAPRGEEEKFSPGADGRSDLFALCLGIFGGILVGMISLKIPGVPVPLKLGSAGGPLLVALFLGRLGRTANVNWTLPRPANLALRELGITIFLACVGLRSGGRFAESVMGGEGLQWMLFGTAISFLPVFVFGFVAMKFMKLDFFCVCGLLSGSMTDPPALSFSEKLCGSEAPAVSFTTVYALTMFLRIIYAQLLVILFLK